QVVDPRPLVTERAVLPRPEQEDQQQGQTGETTEHQPERDLALGALLGLGARHRPARLLEHRLDAVELAAELEELLAGHLGQFGFRGLARNPELTRGVGALDVVGHTRSTIGFTLITHARAPIHRAAAMTATVPMIQIAMPSPTGPNPPRP